MLDALFLEIENAHEFEPAENPMAIHNFEKGCGYELPADLKEFYRRYKSVALFPKQGEAVYRFVEVDEMRITGLDIFGKFYEGDGPNSWYTLCDLLDGNYIAMDLASKRGEQCNFIDCFHETYGIPGESKIIAISFTELLERCLHSGGRLYFLDPGFHDYGDGMQEIQRIKAPAWIPNWAAKILGNFTHSSLLSSWTVHVERPVGSHEELFRDVDYGGAAKSMVAAKKYWEANRRP